MVYCIVSSISFRNILMHITEIYDLSLHNFLTIHIYIYSRLRLIVHRLSLGHRLIGSLGQEHNHKNNNDSLRFIGSTPKFCSIGSKCPGTKVTRLSGIDCTGWLLSPVPCKTYHNFIYYKLLILMYTLVTYETIINTNT